MRKHQVIAVILACVYLGACAGALWDRLAAILLFAAVSPIAARIGFPRDGGTFTRILAGAVIDGSLAALAFVPGLGDAIDLGASLVAFVLLILRFRQLASGVPGGVACLVLYAFLWFEAKLLPHQFSVSVIHHGSAFYAGIIIASMLAGGIILTVLTFCLSLLYDGDWPRAICCDLGFPWFLITFLLTIFLPSRHLRRARGATDISGRA